MRVVAEVEITDIIEGDPKTVWGMTSEHAGISKTFFNRYYKGRDKAVAYQFGEVNIYPYPRSLADIGIQHAPQSFVYV